MDDAAPVVLPFVRSRPIVRREQPDRALNGTLSWQVDEHAAFDRDLDAARARRCYTTGIGALDALVCGAISGNVLLVAGRTGGGKSSFGLTTALTLALANALPVLYASLEMPARDMAIRSLAWLTGISQTRLLQADIGRVQLAPEERQAITTCGPLIGQRLRMMAGSFTMAEIRAEAKRLQDTVGLSLVVLDHVGLVTPEKATRNETREREVAAASRGFKQLAMELDVGALELAQLNRSANRDKEPELWHLRESGGLEQDAAVVAFLWPTEDKATDRARVFVRKNRFGACDVLEVPWDGARGRLGDVVAEAGR